MYEVQKQETLNNDMISDNNLIFLYKKSAVPCNIVLAHTKGVVSHHMRQNHETMMSSGVVMLAGRGVRRA